MSGPRIELPGFAELYLKETRGEGTKNAKVVVLFHGWLRRTGRELAALTGKDVTDFVSGPTGRPVGVMTRNDYRYQVRQYLRWLEQNGFVGPFVPGELEGYRRRPLPEEVRRFLRFITPTRRPSTVTGYRFALRSFHEWLDTRATALANVDREICLSWAQHLDERGLHPATRRPLVCLRKYLDWLWEQGLVAAPGYETLRASDFPKKPDYLPRPLPPEQDKELQSRFKKSESPLAAGLYVMRRTGLRIGELRRLERNCVRDDHAGNRFLKVPLGKLNNERLVPLDDATTLAAIQTLQQRAREDSPWLIEGARERPVSVEKYQATLYGLAGDLPLAEPLTSHRLRHTFATSLMNGGMSLPGIMKLLGHRDHRMTLRYTAIADATVHREYFEALDRIKQRYTLAQPELAAVEAAAPETQLEDLIRWVSAHLCVGSVERAGRLLVRRLEGALRELRELLSEAEAQQPP